MTHFLVTIFLPLTYLVDVEVDLKFPPPRGPLNDVLEKLENLQTENNTTKLQKKKGYTHSTKEKRVHTHSSCPFSLTLVYSKFLIKQEELIYA